MVSHRNCDIPSEQIVFSPIPVENIHPRTYTKLKEVDDVLGGAAAWENVDSVEEKCPK